MRHVGKWSISVLLLSLFHGAAMAQSAWPANPVSELAQSLSSSSIQPPRNPGAWVEDRARRRAAERPRHSSKAMARTIRATAEITVVNEDQVIVRLTRRGIGHINATAVKR